MIDDMGKRVLRLVNDVLLISKISSNNFSLEFVPFSLCNLVQAIVREHRLGARLVQIDVVVSSDIPSSLLGASSRIEQVLTNLLSNGKSA